MQLILLKDNANRVQCKTNLFDFVLLRCSLSYAKIMQIEYNAKQAHDIHAPHHIRKTEKISKSISFS